MQQDEWPQLPPRLWGPASVPQWGWRTPSPKGQPRTGMETTGFVTAYANEPRGKEVDGGGSPATREVAGCGTAAGVCMGG